MIVVAGEALVDLIPTAAGDLSIHPGGGPFNTARWLGRLGAEVGFLGALAADPLGQRLREQLVAAGVALDLVVATELPTTLAVAQLDSAGVAQYSFYTTDTSLPDVWPEQVEKLLPGRLDALYLGSIGLMLEPAASAGLRAVDLAHQRGVPVMLDPNIRPTLIRDRAAYLARLAAVLALTDVLKLSVDDLAWLAPGEAPQAAGPHSLSNGPRVVLLTAGGEGATVLTEAGTAAIPPAPVEVIDTIGAGDAFSAGFLFHWLGGGRRFASPALKTLPAFAATADAADAAESASFAACVGAIACSVRGATPPADVTALLEAS
jgi:fructokinase